MINFFTISIFGDITAPPGVSNYAGKGSGAVPGLVPFLTNLIKLGIVIAGLYAFINIILAGYGFLSAGDDPKKMASAWAKIWQSLIGLLIVAGSFVLAAIFGWIVFGDASAILKPQIFTP